MKNWLGSVNRSHYDTEEKEFICDYFDQLSKIVSVDFKDNLNQWLYSGFLNTLFKLIKLIKGKEKIIRTLSQDCTNCKAKLEIFIYEHKKEFQIIVGI